MRTARAHDRRARWDGLVQRFARVDGQAELFGHKVLAQLALQTEERLACHVEAERAAVCLDDAVQLLHDDQLVDRLRKVQDLLHGQRMDHAEFQHGIAVPADLFDVLIARRGREDA